MNVYFIYRQDHLRFYIVNGLTGNFHLLRHDRAFKLTKYPKQTWHPLSEFDSQWVTLVNPHLTPMELNLPNRIWSTLNLYIKNNKRLPALIIPDGLWKILYTNYMFDKL